jgi:hypothetical protein
MIEKTRKHLKNPPTILKNPPNPEKPKNRIKKTENPETNWKKP